MHNLLTEPVLRVRLANGSTEDLSLPKVYEALAGDRVAAFPALRPHQRHAWHAFLAQLGVIACHQAGQDTTPRSAEKWRSLLRGLTSRFGNDEPWNLLVENTATPAFMQCPTPKGINTYRTRVTTPDDLDILATSKNHDVKQAIAIENRPEDWIFALIDLQTMGNYTKAGKDAFYYGTIRKNGHHSTRPCLGLAPAAGGLGAHLFHDMSAMLRRRNKLLDDYKDYFRKENGTALLWLEPWDESRPLDLRALDPYFIEICRRVRLHEDGSSIIATTEGTKTPRIVAAAANGNVGDFWTPVSSKNNPEDRVKALSLSQANVRYDGLADLIFETKFRHPPSMKIDAATQEHWRLVIRSIERDNKGRTQGYHERSDVIFKPRTVRALFRKDQRDKLAQISEAQIEEIKRVNNALQFGITIAASGGKDVNKKDVNKLVKIYRKQTDPYSRRLDAVADAHFFAALEARFLAADEAEAAICRGRFAHSMIDTAERLLDEAIDTIPCTSIHRHRARARGVSAFWGRLRGAKSVFSDQPEIFDRKEAFNAP